MAVEHDLVSLGFWPTAALERLASNWITSAEQVVAIAATQDGLTALASQTGLEVEQIDKLVQRTREVLPEELRERLDKPADTSLFGRGALGPPRPSNK